MLHYLRCEAKVVRSPEGRRKLRLFACGCCRQVWPLIEDHRSRRLVDLCEQLADGLADVSQLADAEVAARAAKSNADIASAGMSPMTHIRKVGAAVQAALYTAARNAAEAARLSSASALCSVAGYWHIREPNPAWEAHEKQQAALARCIFGNPFRPVALAPSVLAWNDRLVVRLAQAIYDERRWADLPLLGDALLDAGCDNEEVIAHCREPGAVHFRGCWVVDLLTGRG
jgi:hypothetical protein